MNTELKIKLSENIDNNKSKKFNTTAEYTFKDPAEYVNKWVSKNEYVQLFSLFEFLVDNPNLSIKEVREIIYSKPIKFGFLIKCDKVVDDFIDELRRCGAQCMAERIAIIKHSKYLERKTSNLHEI